MKALFALILLVLAVSAKVRYGSVTFDQDTMSFVFKEDTKTPALSDVLAYARWENTLHKEGWHKLHVFTNGDFPSELQMKAAGYLEGRFTYDQIYMHKLNFKEFCENRYGQFNEQVMDFLKQNLAFVRENVWKYRNVDTYWGQVGLTLDQFDGMVKGYHSVCSSAASCDEYLTEFDLWLHLASGDVMDILDKFNPKAKDETMFEHCSALIRLTDDYSQLMVSQNAWFFYGAQNRILKFYDFEVTTAGTVNQKMSFSSYPGLLFSFDDFYVLENGLAVFETTHHFNDAELKDYIKPETNLEWLRVTVANRMSNTGDEWYTHFSRHNSGTYNNMWVVIDYNKFTPGKALPKGTITVIEQLPGPFIYKNDNSSQMMAQGYLGSYNTPSLWATRQKAQSSMDPKDLWGNWDTAGRGQTFKKQAPSVSNLDEMKDIMRYNNRDDHEDFNAFAISSRYDLRKDEDKQIAFGAFDVKIVDQRTIKSLWFHAVAGPTQSHKAPVWSFSEWEKRKDPKDHVPHRGLPDKFDFDWLKFGPVEHCVGLDIDQCFESEACGWCKSMDKCIAGDAQGPLEKCAIDKYQFASKLGVYILIGIVAVLCLVLLGICYLYGISEKKQYEQKLLQGTSTV
ncbi:hypothetical protein P9112_007569 [Eukaryota sp. TZLM1-RC]